MSLNVYDEYRDTIDRYMELIPCEQRDKVDTATVHIMYAIQDINNQIEKYNLGKLDISIFYQMMIKTDFLISIIETLYEIFTGNDTTKATLFLGKIHLNKTIKALEKTLKTTNNQISILPIDNLSKSAKAKLTELTKQKENLIKEIEKYKSYKKEYGQDLTLSAHMIIEYGDKAWVLYAGNHNILSETYVNYNTYFEHIKYCKNKGIKIYDQFGTIGDLSKNNPRLGLHEFKKKFGGDYVEEDR